MAITGSITTGINHSTKAEYRAFSTDLLFGDKYQEKQNNTFGHSFLCCVFCGRDTSKQGKSNGVMVGDGGALIVYPEDYEIATDGGAMGWFPVGSECIKSVPTEFRVANPYDNKVKGV
jgi:hypothetical protein